MILRTVVVGEMMDNLGELDHHTVVVVLLSLQKGFTAYASEAYYGGTNLQLHNGLQYLIPYDFDWFTEQLKVQENRGFIDLADNHEIDRRTRTEHRVLYDRLLSNLTLKDRKENEISQSSARANNSRETIS